MYNPCTECFIRYNKQYTTECDNKCEYAYQLNKLKSFGGIDEVIKIMIYSEQIIFPQTIGDITYYSKKELIEWVENQQKMNKDPDYGRGSWA